MSGENGIRRTGLIAGGVAVAMLGLAYASVPLYRLFCQVTGFGGTTMRVDEAAAPNAVDKLIKVRFDANVAPGLAWTFKPVQTQATIRIGERKMAFYQATNLTDKPITGMATYNVRLKTRALVGLPVDEEADEVGQRRVWFVGLISAWLPRSKIFS